MKNKFIILSILLFTISCRKKDDCSTTVNKKNTIPIQLQNLKEPQVILNQLATGEITGDKMNYIYFKNYNLTPYEIDFEFIENTNKIKKLTFIDPNYLCEVTTLNYSYRADKFIDKIFSKTVNTCKNFVVDKVYNYNYKNGILKSIIMDDKFFVEENYFSYNTDGTIAEMYTDFRTNAESFDGYQKFSYEYNTDKNVTSFTQENYYANTYDQKYTFTYDKNLNPFKGFFVALSSRKPSLGFESAAGPFFLSTNNITSIKKEYLHNNNQPVFEFFDVNIVNNKIVDYGNDKSNQYWFRYYINY